ncbi:MAG: LUD domain-containing protein [Peptococcaceae bacterium]|nr:LUD domain-containing protein [Peptococcaceae bacterium]
MATKDFKAKIDNALQNPVLRGALGNFGVAFAESRDKAYQNYDFSALRDQVAEVKGFAAAHMEEMAEQFTASATARGAKVFRAKTGEEAKQYILALAQKEGVKSIVKSKSMATEEIHLNQDLAKAGYEVQETDLGEWILQLAHQRPSHMVMPAIHMTRQQVADVFTDNLGDKSEPDIPQLVKTARRELRTKFLEAEMGISGANIAVAETGSLVMFTNEGNGRLTSTLPRVHVFVVGLEKLVPKFMDILPIMTALPKSATGQQITSYVTMVTGVTPTYLEAGEIGEKEFHVVLMDNGRSEMYADPKFKKALQCIRCCSCLNVCPAYQLVGGHVYGSIYTGGIGTILTAFTKGLDETAEIQNLCLQCGKCTTVCPGKVDIPDMILELRNRVMRKTGLPFTQKIALDVVSNRRLFHSLLRVASKAQKPFAQDKMIRHLPLFLSNMTDKRSLPAIADVPLRDAFGQYKQIVRNPKGKAAFFAGCLIDFCYPEIGESVIKVLNSKDIEVVFPDAQSCCGAPATYMGDEENARKLAQHNIAAFENVDADYIVSACPTCTHALAHGFVQLLQSDLAWATRAEQFAAKVTDFGKLVHDLGGITGVRGEDLKVTYHDSCHLKRTLGIFREPRAMLQALPGVEMVEMKESDRCCGFAGSYSIKFPEMSGPILERKVNNIAASGADLVCMDCPGCLMQISGGLDKHTTAIKAKHTAQVLAERLSQQ